MEGVIASVAPSIRRFAVELLSIDDLEQTGITIARLRQITAGAVDQNDGAEKVVGFLGAGRAANPRDAE